MLRPIQIGVLVLVLSFVPLAWSQTKSAAAPGGAVDWTALDHKWLDSEKNGDLGYLEKFFADSYVLVLANGQSHTKKEWLDILRGPDRPTLQQRSCRPVTRISACWGRRLLSAPSKPRWQRQG